MHAETQTHSTPAPHLAGCSLELLGILHGDNCHSLLTLCYPLAVPACEADGDAEAQAVEGSRVVLYKGRYMLAFRMLVRFKIFQLVGIAALAVPINTFLAGVSL